jgi:glyceraldehyde-3-phosphate dehydrogenase/erythrose-4-phosphate dehydrogenase
LKVHEEVIPDLKGKLNGFAVRVPTPDVSIVDLVATVEKPTTAEEVNAAFKKASESGDLKDYLGFKSSSRENQNNSPVVKDSVLLLVELLFVILKYFCLTNLSPTWTLN